ncbi:MAG: pseudouridine synthase [Actinomycetota bacterium]
MERDSVAIDGVPLPLNPDLKTWLVYKPPGVVSTMSDPQNRPTVKDLVPADPTTNPVGRLDLHSEGLMLMTNDGDLALRVAHPRYGIEKVYHALVKGTVPAKNLSMLTDGIDLEDGQAKAKAARIVDTSSGNTLVEITMTEGRKREIRRMFDFMGIEIVRLARTAIAGITDRSLAHGEYREVSIAEIRAIYARAEKNLTDD